MDNIAGSPVEGVHFFGRDVEAERLREILSNDDILLLGPRRIGKTSIARAVMGIVRAEGWRAIEINVASCLDECGFLDKLSSALTPEFASVGSKVASAIGDAISAVSRRVKSVKLSLAGTGDLGVELGNGAVDEDWTKLGCELLHLLSQAEQRWLIYVDELPIMLFNIVRNDPHNGVQRVRRFLDWFRNDVRALPGSRAVRWLVSGSIGLDTLVQQHGMADTINSLSHQRLPAFKDKVAVAMLVRLEERYQIGLTQADALDIVKAVQWAQPYYLQMAFHHLRSLVSDTPRASTSSLIGKAIDSMVEPGADNDFHHWADRLDLQLSGADSGHAVALLNLAARDPNGVRPETLLVALEERMPNALPDVARRTFINLRDILERDAYWWPDASSGTKRYRFRLEPLRRWWLRKDTL